MNSFEANREFHSLFDYSFFSYNKMNYMVKKKINGTFLKGRVGMTPSLPS